MPQHPLHVMPVACHNHCMQWGFSPVVCNRVEPKRGVMKAEAALRELVAELDRCIDELGHARERAEELLAQRRSGRSWTEIVSGESRPLVVERISTVLASL